MHIDALPFIHEAMTHIPTFLAAAPIQITCNEINACPSRTPDVSVAFTNATHAIIGIIGGLAVVMVIWNGLQMTLSNGNAKRFAQGRIGLLYSVVGVALAIGAYAIVSFIANSLN